jgi:hypothetical protein
VVDPELMIIERRTVLRHEVDEDGNNQEIEAIPEIRIAMRQMADKTTCQALVQQGLKNKNGYKDSKQRLFNDFILHLNVTLQTPVTQHKKYQEALDDFDVLKIWKIVKECATGKVAHSTYVMIWRFMLLIISLISLAKWFIKPFLALSVNNILERILR